MPKGIPLEPGEQHLAVHVEDHPLDYGELRGRDPEGPVRRRHGRDLGLGHLRARRGEARRRPHRPAARQAARGPLDARPRAPRRQGAELAPDPQAGGRRRADGLADASTRRCSRRSPTRSSCRAARAGSSRSSGTATGSSPRVAGGEAELRTRKDQDYTKRFANVAKELVEGAEDAGLRGRRRGLRARRGGPPELLGDAAGQAGDADRLLRLRPARGRRRAGGRPAALGAAQAAARSCSTAATAPSSSRRRFDDGAGALRGGAGAAARGDHGQAARARSTCPASARATGSSSRRTASRSSWSPATRAARAGASGRSARSCWRRTGRTGSSGSATSAPASTTTSSERLLKKLKPLERKTSPFPKPPKMPRVRKGDVVWVEPKLVAEVSFAEWTHDGRLRAPVYLGLREDKDASEVRREVAGADPGRDPQGQARAAALEPRQAVLARRGDHEGRPARVLPRRGAGPGPAPARPAVHDEAATPTAPSASPSSRRTRRRGCPTGSRR